MTEEQRQLVCRHMRAATIFPGNPGNKDRVRENTDEVLQELNESLGFDIQAEPGRVVLLLEDAMRSHDAADVQCALHVAGLVDFYPSFMPLLINLLELTWHHSHEEIASWFQDLKAPEPVAALYHAALVQHECRAWDDNYVLARRCTWALADIGTAEAYEKLQLLATCGIPMVAEFAQKRVDNWQEEKPRGAT
jgi:hypothetical protein